MKILHTADWHLGKQLERHSIIKEQQAFLDELIEIASREAVDMIVIPGDIFDTVNPPALAEKMFYETVETLSLQGERPVIITSGNHDNGLRLEAIAPLATKQGVFVVGTRDISFASYQNEIFAFEALDEGVLSFTFKEEKVIVLALPYLNERSIGKVVSETIEDESLQRGFEMEMERLLEDMANHYDEDSIHIIMGHFFIRNASSSDELPIKWGGAFDMSGAVFPPRTHYIAMGHMHQAQRVADTGSTAYYSGSPMAFSKSESSQKYVLLVEFNEEKEALVEKIPLSTYTPVVIWKATSISDLLDLAETHQEEEIFVYVELQSNRPMEREERRLLHKGKPIILRMDMELFASETVERDIVLVETIEDEFIDFYKWEHGGIGPSPDIIDAFNRLLGEEEADETD